MPLTAAAASARRQDPGVFGLAGAVCAPQTPRASRKPEPSPLNGPGVRRLSQERLTGTTVVPPRLAWRGGSGFRGVSAAPPAALGSTEAGYSASIGRGSYPHRELAHPTRRPRQSRHGLMSWYNGPSTR
jgi:hypothetical protein